METEKMIFKNIKDVLSRDEMKKVMAGSGGQHPICTTRRYGFYERGLCSGPTIAACEGYCSNQGYYCECYY